MSEATILLVDDDADFLRVLRQRCESVGFIVEQTCNLLSATLLIEKRVPNVVCVDVQMPTGNGLAFCEALATDDATAHVPIVVLTGQSSIETRQACGRLGAQYIRKNVDYWASLEPILRQLATESTTHSSARRQETVTRRPPAGLLPPLPPLEPPQLPLAQQVLSSSPVPRTRR